MKICVYLSYIGLGANLLHLTYCHQIAKKFGPITIITLCENLKPALEDDPLIEKVVVLNKYTKKFFDVFKLANYLKKFSFNKIYIYYPSIRIFFAAKLAKIKNIYIYPILKKKKLHLVHAAKEFTEKNLEIKDCPTYTDFVLSDEKKNTAINNINKSKYNIIIGAGSSGPTTKWGSLNYSSLINKLNENGNYFFYILCGPEEKKISDEIIDKVKKKNCNSLHHKNISEVLPYLCLSDMYVGNDSFGHHVTSQSRKPSLVLMFDTPKAYSDYSPKQYRIIPDEASLEKIDHNYAYEKNSISVEKVYNNILKIKELV